MKKKGWLTLILLSIFMLVMAGCGSNGNTKKTAGEAEGKFTPGTYEGVSKGHGGEIIAKVTVSKDKIEKVEITAEGETGSIGDGAITQLTDEIIASQSLSVDVVSGASESSAGIIEAVTLALEKAGAEH